MPRKETVSIIVIASFFLCLSFPSATASGATSDDALHLQIIVVDSRGQAERVRAALAAGADFAALARQESVDPSAPSGGDLGLIPRRTLRADLNEATQDLAPGQLSPVVAVPTGFAIVRIGEAAPRRGSVASGNVGNGSEAPAPAPSDSFSIAGVQFDGIRRPPYTTGVSYIEGLFRSLPKPEGWNDDLTLFCTVHQIALDTAVERLQSLVTSDDPAVQAQGTPDAGGPDYSSMAPKVLLRNDGGKTFVDVSDSSGTAELHKMHGMTFADPENRGADDIVASMGGAALGARITVTIENKGAGVRKVCRSVNGGGSFGSSPLAQSIGLGQKARILKLEILWPGSRTPQTFRNVPVNGAIEIKESAPTYARIERKQYRLGATQNASLSADHGRKE